jgi:hypothetical protein
VLQRRDMSDRDLSPFFVPKSIAVVGAGERATSSGGAIIHYAVTTCPTCDSAIAAALKRRRA